VVDRVIEVVVQVGAVVFVVFLAWVFKRAAIDKRRFSSSTTALATVVSRPCRASTVARQSRR
jgi:hypothetical protein